MTEYQAKSKSSTCFEVTSNGRPIGTLTYKSWFKFDAVIEIANKPLYHVVPKGFWGTTVELKEDDRVLLQFAMNWNGNIVLQTFFGNREEGYVFKRRGLFKESFILADHEGVELLVMKPNFKWSSMNFEYQITAAAGFEAFSKKDILLMISLHCANYYMTMMAEG